MFLWTLSFLCAKLASTYIFTAEGFSKLASAICNYYQKYIYPFLQKYPNPKYLIPLWRRDRKTHRHTHTETYTHNHRHTHRYTHIHICTDTHIQRHTHIEHTHVHTHTQQWEKRLWAKSHLVIRFRFSFLDCCCQGICDYYYYYWYMEAERACTYTEI